MLSLALPAKIEKKTWYLIGFINIQDIFQMGKSLHNTLCIYCGR